MQELKEKERQQKIAKEQEKELKQQHLALQARYDIEKQEIKRGLKKEGVIVDLNTLGQLQDE